MTRAPRSLRGALLAGVVRGGIAFLVVVGALLVCAGLAGVDVFGGVEEEPERDTPSHVYEAEVVSAS